MTFSELDSHHTKYILIPIYIQALLTLLYLYTGALAQRDLGTLHVFLCSFLSSLARGLGCTKNIYVNVT